MNAIRRNQGRTNLFLVRLVCAGVILLVVSSRLFAELSQTLREDMEAAVQILESWESKGKPAEDRVLHVIAWRCRNRDFPHNYRDRLQRIMLHIQDFYRKEMIRHGLGRRSFNLDIQPSGEMVIHEVVGHDNWRDYTKSDGKKIRDECAPILREKGIRIDQETIMIFTNLSEWDPKKKTFFHKSPYYAGGDWRKGVAWQLDSEELDVRNIPRKTPLITDGEYGRISLGKHNSIFIGGIAHELGHALGLPHCRGSSDETQFGTALMGSGNRTYGDEVRNEGNGSFLSRAHALRLATHPQFSNSLRDFGREGQVVFSDLQVVPTDGRKAFQVTGCVEGWPPVYALVGYLDPAGHKDYDARAITATPDQHGVFTLVCDDLVVGKAASLRIVSCHANGATTSLQFPYAVRSDGTVDIKTMRCLFVLREFSSVLAEKGTEAARQIMPDDKDASRFAVAVLRGREKKRETMKPSHVPLAVDSLLLSRAEPTRAVVGWLEPAYDNLPGQNPLIESAGKLFESGIYAHAPSEHEYDLAGEWRQLGGECGLPSQAGGTVVFVVRADDKEIFRSPVLQPGKTESYKLDLTGVKKLILSTEDAGDGKAADWGLWLAPKLSR